ncbi:Maternal embryonic leucine zipper kinase, partial [Fasciolopsis buskii]
PPLPTVFHPESANPVDRGNAPDLLTLSPSRSIDSQLAQLNQSFQKAHLFDVPFSPRSKCSVLNSDQMLPVSLSGTYLTSFSSTSSSTSRNAQDAFANYSDHAVTGVTRSRGSADDRGSNDSGGMGRWQLGRLRDVFMAPRKPQSLITPDNRSLSQRLRKTRHLNSVVLARRELSAEEVFDRIANALSQESIRFTLKGTGFLCVFLNDWGKTVLSFEFELVYVSTRAIETSASVSIRRRLTLKPRAHHHTGSGPRSPARLTLTAKATTPAPGNHTDCNNGARSREASHGSTAVADSCTMPTDVPDSELQIGVKMKRIRGDSFMYTSICRTILELADIRT